MALTKKNKAFLEEYVANGYNATRAYMKVYYPDTPIVVNDATYTSSAGSAHKVLLKPESKAYIKELQHERFEQLSINADRVAEELSKMAFGLIGSDCSENGKLKALEQITKLLGLNAPDKVEAAVNGSIVFVDDLGDE